MQASARRDSLAATESKLTVKGSNDSQLEEIQLFFFYLNKTKLPDKYNCLYSKKKKIDPYILD